ncbi:hypothetical protein D3C81_2157480 [compost metagenome]
MQTNMLGTQFEILGPCLAKDHFEFKPGCTRLNGQGFQAMKGHEHELFTKGEIFKQ